ncbi:MAG: DPP IV N-terminal domain-containing protein, partial [Candidatus Cloacimonetes bacterium]|nr:DPP IV N-terminal domain-containing protein [Candidatus Cloacimonadota bacterium]
MRRGLILILLTMGFVVVLNAFEPNFASRPAISPDGANVCFVYQGDLWVVPFKVGSARRLTSTSATEQRPLWSPDGRYIAFNSIRDGQNYIYIIAA